MKNSALICLYAFLLAFTGSYSLKAQESANLSDIRYNAALNNYVQSLLDNFGKDAIKKERFLIQQIRMINEEIKSRVDNVSDIRDNYFQRLQERLAEVRDLKSRLNSSGSATLLQFVNELESKIIETINLGAIDYQKLKVIEDATQLVHIAEEMLKLDPNARLESNPKIVEGIQKTKSGFVESFGEDLSSKKKTPSLTGKKPTVFDLYDEWTRTERIKYQMRWTDIKVLKNRLLKNAGPQEKLRMFKRELRQAAEMYNFGYYDLAERSFEEILRSYPTIDNLDDVLFYKGESNYILGRYNRAKEDFGRLVNNYPSSQFAPVAYKRLIQIAYQFNDFASIIQNINAMQALVSSSDPNYEQALLVATIAGLKNGNYENASNYALEIAPGSPYYRQARFMLAEAYAGASNYDEALRTFKEILNTKDLDPDFRNTILLKLAYINYELGDYQNALSYFDQIPSSFSNYDRVLIGYAWTAYRQELQKENTEEQDFSFAKKNLEILLDNFPFSDYYLEAKTLLGYINQLEQDVDDALDNYEFAFNAKDVKLHSDELNKEREALKKAYYETQKREKEALQKGNKAEFEQAYKKKADLKQALFLSSYSDMSSVGVAMGNEVSRLKAQLVELDNLKAKAQAQGRDDLVDQIEDLQLRIYKAVNNIPKEQYSPLGINYFDEHPLARKESMIEYENNLIKKMREDARRQRTELIEKISALDVQIQNAKRRRDYKKLVQLELSRDRFKELSKQLDFVETQAYGFDTRTSMINLNRWSDYGAFGMANVNFAIRKMQSQQIANLQTNIQRINDFLQMRKENIEHRINQIEDEIVLMTRQIRRQERLREREELKRQFEESYFDTHDSEMDNTPDTTEPPKLKDEE